MSSQHDSTRPVVRLGDGRRRIRTAHCPTCKRRVLVRKPWIGFRCLHSLWLLLLLPLLAYLPWLVARRGIALIGLFVFLMALGPLTVLARRPMSCTRCGNALPEEAAPVPGERPVAAPVVALSTRKGKRRSTS